MKQVSPKPLSKRLTWVLWAIALYLLAGYVPAAATQQLHFSMAAAAGLSIIYGAKANGTVRGLLRGGLLGGVAGLASWSGLVSTHAVISDDLANYALFYTLATAGLCALTAAIFAHLAARRGQAA